jgi:DNA-binding MarR family transcriptional regulator
VTRALRPLEKVGLVSTVKNERDARLAMAKLTPAGQALINEASGIVDDTVASILKRAPKLSTKLNSISSLLDSLRT